LLYEGRQIYFGPTSQAVSYFVDLGFEKRVRVTTADFLTFITNPTERLVRQGFQDRVPRSAKDFAQTWEHSAAKELLVQEIDSFNTMSKGKEALSNSMWYVFLNPALNPFTNLDAAIEQCNTRSLFGYKPAYASEGGF
jgi:ATP-binding cassette subfamily G (WHITE) protein 2 (PDR)